MFLEILIFWKFFCVTKFRDIFFVRRPNVIFKMYLPVRHGFDHNWLFFCKCNFSCFCCCIKYGHQIISINSNTHHTISRRTRCNSIAAILILGRRLETYFINTFYQNLEFYRNGESIISTEKDNWTIECGGKVKCGVSIALGCRSFTKVTHYNAFFTCSF